MTSMPYSASSPASASTPCPRTAATHLPPPFAARSFPAARPTSVVFGNFPWRCSAMTRTLLMSDDLHFFVEHLEELLDRAHLAARRSLGRLLHLHDLHLGRHVDAEV